ncbi:MAG: class I SAM-dependent methyltransferase [Gaiellaceae bacterium]
MLRELVKRVLPRLARTGPGKHVVHAALARDRTAERFPEVRHWPERIGGFEDLAFLFTSSQLDHGVASLRFDEAALLYCLVRSLEPGARVVELGRFKGGSTVVMAAALPRGASILSIDLDPVHDDELRAALGRLGLGGVELVVGNTQTSALPDEPVDLLFVDADHGYEGARADVDRWAPLVRAGGHLLLHDAVDTGGWGTTYPGLQRLVAELERDARFARQRGAGTVAHFVRQETSEA